MKKLGYSVFGAFLLALGFAGAAAAQTIDGSLKHVMSFELLIEELDADSATCGITEGRLIKAVKAVTRGAEFNLKGNDYTLYVRVSTLPQDGSCFSAIDMEAYYYGELPLPNYPKGNHAEVVLWENGTILITEQGDHGKEISDTIKALTADLVEDWELDNS